MISFYYNNVESFNIGKSIKKIYHIWGSNWKNGIIMAVEAEKAFEMIQHSFRFPDFQMQETKESLLTR